MGTRKRQNRYLRRKRKRRRRTYLLVIAVLVLIVFSVGYYRSNQSLVLSPTDYVKSESSQFYFLKDFDELEIDEFSASSLAVPEGTKVSGYDVLTNTPAVINRDFLSAQVSAISELINKGYFNNWDEYSASMQQILSRSGNKENNDQDFYNRTARYFPLDQGSLDAQKQKLNSLNTGNPVDITLSACGRLRTGYVYASISDYDKIACEAVLGSLTVSMLNDLSHISTDQKSALRIVNNDHCFLTMALEGDTPVNGEAETAKLKEEYKEAQIANYYQMLTVRIDRLQLYPQISFKISDKTYSGYLVDVKSDASQKILVILIKDYLQELLQYNKLKGQINVQDYRAYEIPESAVIHQDDKDYVQVLEKGYFTENVEVSVTYYDRGKAILMEEANPDLSSGQIIKRFPT